MALSTSAIQLRGHLSSRFHVTPGETSETGKPKSIREDRLGFQCTLVDLILNAQAIGGEPPPSTIAIVFTFCFTRIQPTLPFIAFTKSSIDPLYAFDSEIEKTLHRLRKARNLVVNNRRSSDSIINSNQLCTDNSVASSNIFAEPGQMENNDRTLKELATPDVVYQPWCIQYPQLEPAQTYELKSGLIHLRRPPQAIEGIPHGLLHNEAVEDTGGLHQNEGISILPRWSSKGLVVSTTRRHEAYVLGEVLSGIQNCDHQEGNLWDKAAHRRDSARVLGKIQQTLCHLSTPLDQRAVADPVFL
ncbi:hypothetical protein CR513_50666, partial [Mucuna pruriens]